MLETIPGAAKLPVSAIFEAAATLAAVRAARLRRGRTTWPNMVAMLPVAGAPAGRRNRNSRTVWVLAEWNGGL